MRRLRIRWTRKLARGEEGAVVVEFAMIGIVLFTLIGWLVQGAILFENWLVLTDAVREGARAGVPCYQRSVQTCTAAQVQTVVINAASVMDRTNLAVTVTSANGMLTVSGTSTVPIVAPFVSPPLPNPIPIGAITSMCLENMTCSPALPTAPPPFTATITPTPAPSDTPTITQTPTITLTPTITQTPTKTGTPTNTPTDTPFLCGGKGSQKGCVTATLTNSPVPPTNTLTPVPTNTPTIGPTNTPTLTSVPTNTPTATTCTKKKC
jgi:Flp pilus assembly protein TadG